jgi:radical SAM/Cys-rich protein
VNSFELRIQNDCKQEMYNSRLRILQVNVGFKCNLSCAHCHLECHPARPETMSWETMESVVAAARKIRPELVDITGGAPELNPHLMPFIRALKKHGLNVQSRTNLTVLLEPGYEEYLSFFKQHRIHLVASLPCYMEKNVCSQRGPGTYAQSIQALRELNVLGYGIQSELPLDLVYNPGGPFLPPAQGCLEEDYRRELQKRFGIRFSRLLTITNMPIGRFWEGLKQQDKHTDYMKLLTEGFNCSAVQDLMCRHQICVAWDGRLYDCDFNLALDLSLCSGLPDNIGNFDVKALTGRLIRTGNHCFGCTAGMGSSCGGALLPE